MNFSSHLQTVHLMQEHLGLFLDCFGVRLLITSFKF